MPSPQTARRWTVKWERLRVRRRLLRKRCPTGSFARPGQEPAPASAGEVRQAADMPGSRLRWASDVTVVTDQLIDQMQAVVQEVSPQQVILFGSRARGDERADSDIDLIVVEAEPFGCPVSSSCRRTGLLPGRCGLLARLAQSRIGAWAPGRARALRAPCVTSSAPRCSAPRPNATY